jgi:hypothetical protein
MAEGRALYTTGLCGWLINGDFYEAVMAKHHMGPQIGNKGLLTPACPISADEDLVV